MILTTIDGIPLYSTPQEAVDWAAQNNAQGYHTHTYQGQIGYMGGATHAAAMEYIHFLGIKPGGTGLGKMVGQMYGDIEIVLL